MPQLYDDIALGVDVSLLEKISLGVSCLLRMLKNAYEEIELAVYEGLGSLLIKEITLSLRLSC
jgi:hypothetical protein